MNYQSYISLIKDLEVYAAKHSAAYRYKVGLLASLGYAYIIGMVILLVSLPLIILAGLLMSFDAVSKMLLIFAKLWWVAVPVAIAYFSILGGILKAFMVKVPKPEGREIVSSETPAIFEFVGDICKKLKAARPQKILITDEFNAAVVTIPRIGMFGRRVYLLLGLPLMKALSPEQFRAVIIHEIGHISGRHGSFVKWAYQLQESWSRIFESQAQHENKAAFLYEKFVKWFFPYFGAYSFVLMREHEREADSYAVQYAGEKPLGEALLALRTRTAMLSEVFWKGIEKENAEHEVPTPMLFSRMMMAFDSGDGERDRSTVEKALEAPTDYADTHPSLAERLKKIGYWSGEGMPALPQAMGESAAEYYVGDLIDDLTGKFDMEWQEKAGQGWKERYEYYQKSDERLTELLTKEELDAQEWYEKACIIAEKQKRSDAIPELRALLERFPDHAEAAFALGYLLLEEDDETGFELLRRSVELDGKLKARANDAAFQYLRAKGRFEEAAPYADALEESYAEIEKAQNERKGIFLTDEIIPHKLSPEHVEAVKKILGFHEEIVKAFVVSKEVKYFSDIPFNGLFLIFDFSRAKSSGVTAQDIVDTLIKQIEEYGVNFIYAFDPSKDKKGIARVSQVENACIYSVAK
ncbi:MAG TPA: M48 family metalloprotease [Pyrinomonadaceae bacterium]|jgi:Zn-dependent protease with chaperone function|nr:M48 family metalloprotease [Pyrinomonadaceae bacterium]